MLLVVAVDDNFAVAVVTGAAVVVAAVAVAVTAVVVANVANKAVASARL